MNNEKLIDSLDWLAVLCIKAFIMFQVLDMLLTAISIRIIGYRLLSVFLNSTTIAIAIHYHKRLKSGNSNPENYFTKQVLIGEGILISKVYLKVVFYMTIILLLLSRITTYN